MRRIAWKQCRSCSADSLSMWLDSLASNALAGWMRSPRACQNLGHRMLGQPVDLEVRMQLAQLVRDRDVPLRRARARSATRCRARACDGTCRAPSAEGGGAGLMKSRRSRFTLTGSRTCERVARPLEHDQLAAGVLRRARRHGIAGLTRRSHRG